MTVQTIVSKYDHLRDEAVVSVTLARKTGPLPHDVKYLYTSMSGASLQSYVPSHGMEVVACCSLDEECE